MVESPGQLKNQPRFDHAREELPTQDLGRGFKYLELDVHIHGGLALRVPDKFVIGIRRLKSNSWVFVVVVELFHFSGYCHKNFFFQKSLI